MNEHFEPPQWDVPGWDWDQNDFSWLDAGVYHDGVSIFFIHGGRIRHQGHISYGYHSIEDFIATVRRLADGLDNPRVCWVEDTGGGDPGLWVEGTRPPREDDLERLHAARDNRSRKDESQLRDLRRRRPDLFPCEDGTRDPEAA